MSLGPLTSAFAAEVRIEWDPNTEPTLAGYKIYYGETSRNYPKDIDVGTNTTYILSDLLEGKTYYISATAYDSARMESDFSNEIVHQVPASASCTFAISPASQAYASSGGSGTVTLTTQSGCPWTPVSNVPWLTINSTSTDAGSGTIYSTVTANTTPEARTGSVTVAGKSFAVSQAGLPQYTIAATAQAYGSISPQGAIVVNQGANQAFTISPNAGYLIADVRIDGVSRGTVSSFTFSNVGASHAIDASFSKQPVLQYSLSVSRAGSGSGVISKNPEATVYNSGSIVTLTATPDDQSTFSGWSGGCSAFSPTCSLTITANAEVIAAFSSSQTSSNASFIDVNGDGKTDILWFDQESGNVYVWYLNGTRVKNIQFIRNVNEPHWKMVGSGNSDGKGKYNIFWHNEATGQVYAWLMQGEYYQTAQFISTVADTNWKAVGAADLDGDRVTDLLWQNQATGQVYVWLMNGLSLGHDQYIRTVSDPNWKIWGVGDFNGDQNPDILWQHQVTGDLYVWFMKGPSFVSDQMIRRVNDLKWKVMAVGNLNQDSNVEILWQHQGSKALYVWYLGGVNYLYDQPLTFAPPSTRKAEVSSSNSVPTRDNAASLLYPNIPQALNGASMLNTSGDIAGLGDFNGDGYVDILSHNQSSGEVRLILMNENTSIGSQNIRTVSDTNWKIVGVGDFNKDGHPDILWQHMLTGDVYVWFMNGTSFFRDQPIGTVPDTQWQIAGVGDFNKDGNPDILWQHQTNGNIYAWYMDGPSYVRDEHIATLADPKWRIIQVGDYNGDGHPDILWRHPETGDVFFWNMNGPSFIHEQYVASKPN